MSSDPKQPTVDWLHPSLRLSCGKPTNKALRRLRPPGDLPLHLFAKFQRMIDFLEHFGSPSRAAHDHRPVSKQSSPGWLFHRHTFNPRKKDFDRAAIDDARLHDHSFASDGHLREIALEEANEK